jgi:hypothetical protein
MKLIILEGLIKVFLHPPPPLEREGFVKTVGLIGHKMNVLSS